MEVSIPSITLSLLAVAVVRQLFSTVHAAFRSGIRRVPGPWLAKFTPFWRVWFVWAGGAHDVYRKLHEQYGAIVRTAPNVVDISDPGVVSKIYGINSKFIKSQFYTLFSAAYEDRYLDSLFSERDPELHKALKRPVSQKFSMTSIRTLEYLVDPCSDLFTRSMLDLEGQVVDLGVWVQWYAFDVIGNITFSKTFGFMEKREDVNNVISGIEFGLHYGAIIGQVPWLHAGLLRSLTVRRALQKLIPGFNDPLDIVTQMVIDALKDYDAESKSADGQKRADFLAYLRQQQQQPGGSPMSDRDVVNHLMGNLLAGSDTTGISLRAVFYYVLRNKEAYRKLQKEIDDAHAAGKLSKVITYAESLELEYLQLCLKEAMRMHPGVSYPLERIVPEGGAELCGVHLEAGAIVGVNAAVIHRNREIFGDDADEFNPERWLGEETKVKAMERHLLTFGAGARTCIGKNISIMEMGKLVPQILRQFDLEWASTEPEWTVKTYWFAKQSGLLVKFKARAP